MVRCRIESAGVNVTMSVEIQTGEPSSFTAGDTVKWTKSLADYPASEWELTYGVQAPDGTRKTIAATANGDDHLAVITALLSASYGPGVNHWTSYATNIADDERVTVESGRFTINPNLAAAAPETFSSRALAELCTAYEVLAGKKFSSTSVNGQTYTFTELPQLLQQIEKMEARVRAENAQATGQKQSLIRVRFGRAI